MASGAREPIMSNRVFAVLSGPREARISSYAAKTIYNGQGDGSLIDMFSR